MNFPELPEGYRWRITPGINGDVGYVYVTIELSDTVGNLLDGIVRWWTREKPQWQECITYPTDETVAHSARRVYARFMAGRCAEATLPNSAQGWESALNSGAIQ